MTRALSTACVALVLCCLVGHAHADEPKPKIAVLGLEASPNREGIVDPQTTDVARQVTKELRERARGGAGGVVVAPNSDRELVDEKALANCDSEAAGCMAAIGAGLATNYLLYGRVEKKGDTYKVTLRLLDVKLKTVEPASGELEGKDYAPVARRLYSKLVGKDATLLIVNANAKAGKVMVDDDYKGKLVKGTVKIAGLSDGRHTLAIESVGYERYEASIILEHNETLNHTASMVERDTGGGDDEKWTGWKSLFFTGLAGAAITGSIQIYLEYEASLEGGKVKVNPLNPNAMHTASQDDCVGSTGQTDTYFTQLNVELDAATNSRGHLNTACSHYFYAKWGWVPTGALLAVAALSLYEWKFTGEGEHATQTAKHARKSVDYVLVPVATAQTAGMSLFLTW